MTRDNLSSRFILATWIQLLSVSRRNEDNPKYKQNQTQSHYDLQNIIFSPHD